MMCWLLEGWVFSSTFAVLAGLLQLGAMVLLDLFRFIGMWLPGVLYK